MRGDVLGKYIICEELGRGAFGVVHRAIERATGKNWAAKFIHCKPKEKEVVRHEIDIMNSLHHPKLMQLHEAFDSAGEMVMILEMYVYFFRVFVTLISPDKIQIIFFLFLHGNVCCGYSL